MVVNERYGPWIPVEIHEFHVPGFIVSDAKNLCVRDVKWPKAQVEHCVYLQNSRLVLKQRHRIRAVNRVMPPNDQPLNGLSP